MFDEIKAFLSLFWVNSRVNGSFLFIIVHLGMLCFIAFDFEVLSVDCLFAVNVLVWCMSVWCFCCGRVGREENC